MEKQELGKTITLEQIKYSVRQRKSLEFTATADAVNHKGEEFSQYVEKMGRVSFPPLLDRHDLLKALWNMNPSTEDAKWDFIVLLTYFNNGQIFFDKFDDSKYLVTIKF